MLDKISINLEKFMDKKAVDTLKGKNLHKLAAIIERNKGEEAIGEQLDLASAVYLLGKKAYLKNASFNKIKMGLEAYKDLKRNSNE